MQASTAYNPGPRLYLAPESGGFMKYPLTLIAGIVAVIAISLGAVVAAQKADEALRHLLYGIIFMLVAPTVTTLLALLRNEKNAEKIDQNTALTSEAAKELAEFKLHTETGKAEIARLAEEAKKELLHQLKGARNAASLAAEASLKAMERSDEAIAAGQKAYSEANDVNRKLAELRTDLHVAQTVEDVDRKVSIVDEKVTDIKKHVEHDEPPAKA